MNSSKIKALSNVVEFYFGLSTVPQASLCEYRGELCNFELSDHAITSNMSR